MNDENDYFARALVELREKNMHEATFARAFADGLGDAERTKALYVKYRAAALLKMAADEKYQLRELLNIVDRGARSGIPAAALPMRPENIPVPEGNRIAAAVLAILFGWLGVHKIYMGKFRTAMVMGSVALIGVLMGFVPTAAIIIISIYEAICYLTMRDEEFHRKYIVGERNWF